MSGLIDRLQPRTATASERPRVLDVDSDETAEVMDALSSATRRDVLGALFERPETASGVATELDTSVQNTHYHLTALREAGLVEAVGERYSEKGAEMTVYAPANDPIVLVGDPERRSVVRRSMNDLVAGLGLLALGALLVQWGAERLLRSPVGGGAVEPAEWTPSAGAGEAVGWFVFDLVEPGVLFFFGAIIVIALATHLLE